MKPASAPDLHQAIWFMGLAAIFGLLFARPASAHEGHAPLPTKGATVQGNHLLLTPKARETIGIETIKVALGDIVQQAQARARVQLPWDHQAMITTLVSGRVNRVHVRPGDTVDAGQVLASVESLELETLQRDLLRAKSRKTLADRILAQHRQLNDADALSRADLSEAKRDAAEASAETQLASRKLLALGMTHSGLQHLYQTGERIKSLPIVSPIKGIVVHADVRVGQVVATDEHLFHVVDLSELEMAGEVLESDVPRMRVGQSVEATITAVPGVRVGGRIDHTHLTVEPESRALTVIAHVENPDRALKPGMTGSMTIDVGPPDQVVVCPTAAVVTVRGSPYVLVDRGEGRYERREVKLGIADGYRVEVQDGVFPGDQVVVTGTNLLAGLFGAGTPGSARDATRQVATEGATDGLLVAHGLLEVPVDRKQFASSQVEGRVARIFVHPGDRVQAGQILAEIESIPLRSLQLELLQSRARLAWSRESFQRSRALTGRNAEALSDYWREEAALEVAAQTIDEVRSKLLMLGVDDTTIVQLEEQSDSLSERDNQLAAAIPIRAPMDGQLEHFEIVPGQVVVPAEPGRAARPEKPLFEIHDRSRLWVCAHVREPDIRRVRVGQPARVSLPSAPSLELSGTVIRVSPVLEDPTRVLPVWIEIDNSAGTFFEGMLARAVIEVGSSESPAGPMA
jgi:cobalt-zinc-cadmium efflux system membrane fusion protein